MSRAAAKRGPYRTDTAMPDHIQLGGTEYHRLEPLEIDLLVPILSAEVPHWRPGPNRDRLMRVINRLREHT